MTEAKNLYQNRRSVYALGKNLPVSEQEVLEIIDNAVKHSPSAFNSQTAHVVVLLGENHQKLWDITFGELEKFLKNEEAKATTKGKIDSFAAAYGTILFFEDHNVVKGLQEQFPSYADNFPIWSEQSTGIASFAVWNALAEAGVGANIQHYNPVIDEKVAAEWDIPANLVLRAQMPFGEKLQEAAPIERTSRVRVVK
ncbi:nitroreductase family protein [uncultured Gemella sp.]|uniref:nitroreductase family protein n=1 Tax=uncultured Gemella sp. TaxID=254352 RepID=UPI0028D65481|nr:nitroreductase family protein [uncultured Gemella sp.]